MSRLPAKLRVSQTLASPTSLHTPWPPPYHPRRQDGIQKEDEREKKQIENRGAREKKTNSLAQPIPVILPSPETPTSHVYQVYKSEPTLPLWPIPLRRANILFWEGREGESFRSLVERKKREKSRRASESVFSSPGQKPPLAFPLVFDERTQTRTDRKNSLLVVCNGQKQTSKESTRLPEPTSISAITQPTDQPASRSRHP